MSDIEEGNKCYQRAFKIPPKGLELTKEHVEVFKKVKGFLDDVWVDQINSFKPGNKGILLIGGDYDLLRGIVSYIWYKHRLINPVSGNNSKRSHFFYGNFAGMLESEVRDFLFSKNWLSNSMHGSVLFLRNIKTEYTDILERIAAIQQEIDDSPIIREQRGRMLNYGITIEKLWNFDTDDTKVQRRQEWPKFKLMPSILVMNVKQTERLLEEFLNNFEVIELEPGKKSKIISQQQSLDQKPSDTIYFPTPANSTWIHVEIGIDYYNKKLHAKVKNKSQILSFSKVGLSHGHSKEDKTTDLLRRLLEYANEENNVIYSHKLAENVFRKLDSDTKRLNRLFRSYFKTIKGPAISYKKGEGFKVQFGKLYLKDTDYDKAREVTTNALQDIPDSNIKDYENLD